MQEIFVRRSYLRHELSVVNNSVVFDVGANLGFFSLQCLREAKNVQVGKVLLLSSAEQLVCAADGGSFLATRDSKAQYLAEQSVPV